MQQDYENAFPQKSPIRGLLIPDDLAQPCSVISVDVKDYRNIGKVVGGYIELVSLGDSSVHGYVDEDGKLKRRSRNIRTTTIYILNYMDVIAGPLIIFGTNGDMEDDVPEGYIETVEAIIVQKVIR